MAVMMIVVIALRVMVGPRDWGFAWNTKELSSLSSQPHGHDSVKSGTKQP